MTIENINVGVGILQPAFMNKFRFTIGDSSKYKLISNQTTKVKFNLVAQTLEVWAEQPLGDSQLMMNLIRDLAGKHRNTPFSVDFLDGCDNVVGQLSGFVEMQSHELNLDYAKSSIATHHMSFKYCPNENS